MFMFFFSMKLINSYPYSNRSQSSESDEQEFMFIAVCYYVDDHGNK